jgi:DNA-binding CsgD family transcriptional regulator
MSRSKRSPFQRKDAVSKFLALGLTERETEVLLWIAQGKGNYEIAVILGAAVGTVRKHVERILRKLKVENRTAAAAIVFVTLNQIADFF